MKSTIIAAINDKRVLTFSYKGHPRTVEPHAVGRSTASHDVLRGYQTAGTAEKGDVPDWKLMRLVGIRNLTVTEQTFAEPRAGYKRGDSVMTMIYAEI